MRDSHPESYFPSTFPGARRHFRVWASFAWVATAFGLLVWLLWFYIVDFLSPILPKPMFVEHTCWFEVNIERKTRCAYLYVASDRSSKDPSTIRLPVVVFETKESKTNHEPVLVLPGGPTPALAVPELSGRAWEEHLSNFHWLSARDVVAFDYRGTGSSVPSLYCPQLPQFGFPRMSDKAFTENLRDCMNRMLQKNIALGSYNTGEIASDIIDLRTSLAVSKWTLWGSSYGSRVALEVLRQDSDGVKNVILSGVLPPNKNWWEFSTVNFDNVMRAVISQCKNDSSCDSSYPSLSENLKKGLRELRRNPDRFEILDRWPFQKRVIIILDDIEFLNLLQHEAITYNGIRRIPMYLTLAGERKMTRFRTLLEDYLLSTRSLFITPLQYFSVHCNDYVGDGNPSPELPKNGFLWDTAWPESEDTCEIMNLQPTKRLDSSPVESSIPVLILSGQLDPITPPDWATEVANSLSNSQLFILPYHTHDLENFDCAKRLISRFLQDSNNTISDSCINELHKMPFVFSY